MLQPAFRWHRPPVAEANVDALEAGRPLGLSERQVRLLVGRGIAAEELAGFVGRAEDALHDPLLLPDAPALVERVRRVVLEREAVLVFGDFDADGLSGLAVLVEAFRALGVEVAFHVPSRVADGHGLSVRAVEEAAARGCRLIVTVDCGTASADEITLAASHGIDVIVTDHHHVPAQLPGALAVVNPQRRDSSYPDPRISGAGVAFKVAQLILSEFGGDNAPRRAPAAGLELAELAAIGTVADVAPLVGENRAIVRLGLAHMRERPRPGLAALLARAGVAVERIDVETLGYVVAPRLNAAGRLGDATIAARLLLSRDAAESGTLAAELEAANAQRRGMLGLALEEARASLLDGPIVSAVGAWSPGIIGLVAGRLAEEHRRPAIVVSTDVVPWRASARSAGGFDLARALEACTDLLERHGGHPDAAGCSFAASVWEPLRGRLSDLAAVLEPPDLLPTLIVDLAVPVLEVDYRLFRELAALEPTGAGNSTPLIGVLDVEVLRTRAVSGGHSQLTLRKGREVLDGIAFERPDLAAAVVPGDRLDIVVRLASREFGGYESLQLEVRDAAVAGHAPWVDPGTPSPVGFAASVTERPAAAPTAAGAPELTTTA